MEECVFCKIIKGEIPSLKVYEDEETIVFMDTANDVDGHILAAPKKHCKNILDCDTDTINSLMKTVKFISEHLVENCGYDGINLLNANDESAGQSVPHFHIHVIPRQKNDNVDAWPKFDGAKHKIDDIFKKIAIR